MIKGTLWFTKRVSSRPKGEPVRFAPQTYLAAGTTSPATMFRILTMLFSEIQAQGFDSPADVMMLFGPQSLTSRMRP